MDPQQTEKVQDDTRQPAHRAEEVEAGPVVSSRTRTAIYITCLAVNVLTLLGFGLAEIFELVDTEKSARATMLILGAVGLVSTGLSVGYRPTRPGAPV